MTNAAERADVATSYRPFAADAVARAEPGGTVVVFHTAVPSYPDPPERARFVELVTDLPVRWISQEAASVFPGIAAPPGSRLRA